MPWLAFALCDAENWEDAVRHKITMSVLLVLCGLALLVEHLYDLEPFTGDHLVAGGLMLALAVIVLCLPSESQPRLLALTKKLSEKAQPSTEQPEIIRDIEN